MGILVDTNIFISAESKLFDLDELSRFSNYGEVFISAVSVSELLAGVHLATTEAVRVRRSAFVEAIIGALPVLDFNEEVSRTYAELYAYHIKRKRKSTASLHDLQIAATAISHGYPVLTFNQGDFKNIPGLDVLKP